jgi:ATP-dependent DNA helicase PIF1
MTQSKALTILKTGATVFLTGQAGAGKTYVINQFTDWLREKGITYAVTASTGIASTHIGGITIHSWSGLGIKEKVDRQDLDMLANKPHVIKNIQNCKVLIIDEISMLDGNTLDNIEKIITHVRGTTLTGEVFGGLQVIFVGDFYQLPPVVKRGMKAVFAFDSKAWQGAKPVTCYITEQHRQKDETYLGILNGIREGVITDSQKKLLAEHKIAELPKTKLFTHNQEVDYINHEELKKVKGLEFEYRMYSSGNDYLVAMLKKNCLSPEILVLKKGALVMFTRNNFDAGYVNGTLGTIIDLDDSKIMIQTKQGQVIELEELSKWSIGDGEDERANIRQFPLRLAWAITVHKSQGMSLDSAVIDLSNCFEYGQGYVALSRVCSLSGLYLEGINAMAYKMHPQVIEMDKEFRKSSDEMDAKFE